MVIQSTAGMLQVTGIIYKCRCCSLKSCSCIISILKKQTTGGTYGVDNYIQTSSTIRFNPVQMIHKKMIKKN